MYWALSEQATNSFVNHKFKAGTPEKEAGFFVKHDRIKIKFS